MPRPVPVVQPLLPKELSSQCVQGEPAGSFGEDDFVKSNDAFQDQRICFPLHGRGFSEMQRARRISGSVQVLRPRIAKIDCLRVNDGAIPWFRLVVNDCRVGSGGGYRIKGQSNEVFVFSIKICKGDRFDFEETKQETHDRNCSSLSAACTSSSFVPLTVNSSSSQAKYSTRAAPSRT